MNQGGFNFEVRHPTDKAIRRPRRSRCNLWRFDHARATCGTIAPTRAASRSSEVKQRPRRVAGFLFGSWAAGPDDRSGSGYFFFPPTRFWFARSTARCTACGDRTGLSSDSSGSWGNARKPSKSSHWPTSCPSAGRPVQAVSTGACTASRGCRPRLGRVRGTRAAVRPTNRTLEAPALSSCGRNEIQPFPCCAGGVIPMACR